MDLDTWIQWQLYDGLLSLACSAAVILPVLVGGLGWAAWLGWQEKKALKRAMEEE